MPPSSRRDREYARRRHEEWAARQQERLQQRRRTRRTAVATGSAVVGVLVVVLAAVALNGRSGGSRAAVAPVPTAGSTATPSVPPSASASASAAPNPCPTPTVTPPASPATFAKAPSASLAAGKAWLLTLRTTCGTVKVRLDGARAPRATASAIFLAREDFWAGTTCHRLTTQQIFVLQCGDPTGTGSGGPGYTFGPVENAPKNGRYPAGTLAMARASSPSSNGSQFFLVYDDTELPTAGGGYTVFGTVVSGLDVVRKVAAGGSQPSGDGKPVRPVSIVSASVAPA